MQDLSIDIKTMPQAFGRYHLLLVITCDQTNFAIMVPLRDRQTQTIAKALIYRVIYLFSPPRWIVCDEAAELIARPEYGTVYQHQDMLLQNFHCRYLYIVI